MRGENMDQNKEYLVEELKKAEEAFEKAKAEAIRAIEGMNFRRAEDYGAAYCSHIDKITAAAARVKALGDVIVSLYGGI